MNRTDFVQQINVAMIHANRKLISAGLPASALQLFVIAVFFFLIQSNSKNVLLFMVIALPVSIAISIALAFAVRRAFNNHAPSCPACAKPIGLLNRRKAMAIGLCPTCGGSLFGP